MHVYLTLDLMSEVKNATNIVQAVRVLSDTVAKSGLTLSLKLSLDIARAVRAPGATFAGGWGKNGDEFLVKF